MKWLSYSWMALKAFLATIPLIKALVEAFETPGFGAEKKKAVLDALDKALAQMGVSGKIKDAAVGFANWLIDSIVYIKNLSGEFLHEKKEDNK